MATEARRSRAVLVTPIRSGWLLGVPSFSADMPWPRGPEDELLSGLLVLSSLPMDSWRCDEGDRALNTR